MARVVRVAGYVDEYRHRARLADARAMAGRPAAATDFLNGRIRNALDWRREFSVLDVGCGDGSLLALVAPLVASALGIVPTAEEVERLRATHGSAVRFDVGTATDVPAPDAAFDVVVCNGVLLCLSSVAEAAAALCELARVLKGGGVAWVGEVLGEAPTVPSAATVSGWWRSVLRGGPRPVAHVMRRGLGAAFGRGDPKIFRAQAPLVVPDAQFRSMVAAAGLVVVDASHTVSLGADGPRVVASRLDYRLTRP